MIWFTADTHFGHKRILEYCPGRGYESVEAMNEGLVENWNATVAPTDIIYHLGDVCFMNKADTVKICQRLNGYKVLILGNHDLKRSVTFWKEEAGFAEAYKLGYGTTHEIAEGFSLSHYPYREDLTAYDERTYLHHHAPEASSSFLLHGHVHARWCKKDHMINVGVDVWANRPVDIGDLRLLCAGLSSNPY